MKERNGYKLLSYGDAEGAVYIQPENIDTFEKSNGTASGYPSGTKAGFVLTDEKAISGKKSGKLSFAFTNSSKDTQAAYLNFTTAKQVPAYATHISVFVYAPCENYQCFRRCSSW